MEKALICVLLFTFGLTSCNKKGSGAKKDTVTENVVKYGIKFRSDSFDSLLEKAKVEGKPIFLDFYTKWCMPCKWMDQDVFSHRNVYEYYNDNIISIKVDAEKGEGPALVTRFKVTGYPTFVYIDGEGNVLEQYSGMTTISNVVGMGERAVQVINQSDPGTSE